MKRNIALEVFRNVITGNKEEQINLSGLKRLNKLGYCIA